MVSRGSNNKVINCPNNHQNPKDSVWCDICGLPIIDYDRELELLLKTLAEEERHTRFAKENVFLGIGEQGCKLVHEFHHSWGKSLKSSAFLMIESSSEGKQFRGLRTQPADQEYTSPSLSLHLLPMSAGKQVGYYGLGERLASNDPNLDDRLLRCGIRASNKKQTIFLFSALGGGTGSGASPYVLQRAHALNPYSRSLVIATMPAAYEPDSAHFNAFCSLSRFIKADEGPLADMILLMDHDRLMKVRGVDGMGEEIAKESLLSYIVGILVGAIADRDSRQADPGFMAKMSRSMGIHAFVPCMAVGRSMEIFGGLTSILQSALSSPLAEVDKESIMISYLSAQVPERLTASLQAETINAEFNKWNKKNFPHLKGSGLQLSYSSSRAERIDLCLLLGGTRLAITAKRAKEGFERFKAIAKGKAWEQEFGATSESVPEAQEAVNWYDTMLDEIANRT